MTTTLSWRPLGGVEAKQLGEARLQGHYAVQWLARLARAAVPALPNDSHTNLGSDGRIRRLSDPVASRRLLGSDCGCAILR